MSNAMTNCISCGSGKIKRKRGPFPATVHGKTVKVPSVEYYCCSDCGETFLDLDNEAKLDRYLEQQRIGTVTAGSP